MPDSCGILQLLRLFLEGSNLRLGLNSLHVDSGLRFYLVGLRERRGFLAALPRLSPERRYVAFTPRARFDKLRFAHAFGRQDRFMTSRSFPGKARSLTSARMIFTP